MALELGLAKYPETEEARSASLAEMEEQIQRSMDRTRSVKLETQEMVTANRQLASENRALLQTVSAVNERDFASMRNETGVLERAQNALQRDINILELQLKKLHKTCQLTDMEFNAVLTAIQHLSAQNDAFEDTVQEERSVLTPAALQAAFELIQKTISEKLATIAPEYVR